MQAKTPKPVVRFAWADSELGERKLGKVPLPTPTFATPHSAGFDLCSVHDVLIGNGAVAQKVPLGLIMEIPEGYVGLLHQRSSLSKKGLVLSNSVGVIDSDYRGELITVLHNRNKDSVLVARGERIAQLIIVPVATFTLGEADSSTLTRTIRGEGGFGSTGLVCCLRKL